MVLTVALSVSKYIWDREVEIGKFLRENDELLQLVSNYQWLVLWYVRHKWNGIFPMTTLNDVFIKFIRYSEEYASYRLQMKNVLNWMEVMWLSIRIEDLINTNLWWLFSQKNGIIKKYKWQRNIISKWLPWYLFDTYLS